MTKEQCYYWVTLDLCQKLQEAYATIEQMRFERINMMSSKRMRSAKPCLFQQPVPYPIYGE
jgi:hypothetical protein